MAVALVLTPAARAAVAAQDAPPSTPVDKRGLVTVADAIKALQKADGQATPSKGATAPVPAGNVGQWFGPNDYPAPAMRAGEQGRVIASVGVDATGRVTSCRVVQSSNSASLDEATCRITQAKVAFKPARDDAGHAVAGEYRMSIRWTLPNDTPVVVPMMTALVSIGDDGAILSCVKQSAAPSADICAAFPKGQKVPGLDAMKGKVIMLATLMRPLADQ